MDFHHISIDAAVFRRLNTCTYVDILARGTAGYFDVLRKCMDVIDAHPNEHFIAVCDHLKIDGFDIGFCPVRLHTAADFTADVDLNALREWVATDGFRPLTFGAAPTISCCFTYPEGQYQNGPGAYLPRRFENVEFFDYTAFTVFQRIQKMTTV